MWADLGPTFTLALVLVVAWASELKPTTPPIFTNRPFVVAWDVPTQDCGPRHKVPLNETLQVFDVRASPNEGFVNQNITIFYRDRLGLYPHFNAVGKSIHGGVPQNGSLWAHLKMLQEHVEHYIRTQEPAGLAVIDWEDWRPVWLRNWQDKDVYRRSSRQLVASRHPNWSSESHNVDKQAQLEFEFAARQFMLETLRFVKAVRPRHLWGFYLFPDCYNHDYVQNWESYTGRCPDVEVSRNDLLSWLWAESTALFPSVYLDEILASSAQGRNFVSFRIQEALRVANIHHANHALPVYVFTRPSYSRKLTELSEMDLISTIGESAALGAAGVILWGDAVYTTETCQHLKDYLTRQLIPYVVNVSWAAQYCSLNQCEGHGRCVRRDANANTFLHLSATSFRLVPGQAPGEPQLHPQGKLNKADLAHLQTHFRCQCYLGWGGEHCQLDHRQAAGAAGSIWTEPHLPGLLALVTLTFTWTW